MFTVIQALEKLADQIQVNKWTLKGEKFIRLSSLQDQDSLFMMRKFSHLIIRHIKKGLSAYKHCKSQG